MDAKSNCCGWKARPFTALSLREKNRWLILPINNYDEMLAGPVMRCKHISYFSLFTANCVSDI